jgi:hypothetical protein
MTTPDSDSLFCHGEWRDVSGCALVTLQGNGVLDCLGLWVNPHAVSALAEPVIGAINRLA